MTFFQALILSIVQGITEFLPISSSGHLVLFQKIFRIDSPPVVFDILLHLGTLAAVIVFFKKRIVSLILDWRQNKKIWLFLIIGSFPAAFLGYFLRRHLTEIFNSLLLLSVAWIFFSLMLLSSYYLFLKKKTLLKKAEESSWTDGLVVGLFQAFALFPGISRSGSTMIGSFLRKFSSQAAFELSFLLSIPAILGATGLEMVSGYFNGFSLPVGFICMVVSGMFGYLSLAVLQKIVVSDKFYYFGYYCLLLGIVVLLITVTGQ